MRCRFVRELKRVVGCRSFALCAAILASVGLWCVIVCRNVTLLWHISRHPPLTLPLFAVRLIFLTVCAMYSANFTSARDMCAHHGICVSVISAAFFIFWYPLALSAGLFTLSASSLALSALTLLWSATSCTTSSFMRYWRAVMLIVMGYFAYLSVGATPLG